MNEQQRYAAPLLKLLDTRKALITEMEVSGMNMYQIFRCLEIPYMETIDECLEAEERHYAKVAAGIAQFDLAELPLDSDKLVYFFSWKHGMCEEVAKSLLKYNSPYNGEKFVASPKEIIPEILLPLVNEVVKESDIARLRQVTSAVEYVISHLLNSDVPK